MAKGEKGKAVSVMDMPGVAVSAPITDIPDETPTPAVKENAAKKITEPEKPAPLTQAALRNRANPPWMAWDVR